MKKFKNDSRGVVTVMVAMLLIPAILISGTAVDIARIHASQSIMQSANQLAANSVLTQYNALAKDLYGLYGVAEDDPILGDLINRYIELAVFGDDQTPVHDNSLKPFYGVGDKQFSTTIEKSKNLEEVAVLRHQIEEYMKIRGPVLIVQEIMEQLSGDNKIDKDIEVIEKKTEIDEAIAELCEDYKKLYDLIVTADKCRTFIATSGYDNLSKSFTSIQEHFVKLKICYEDWEEETDENKKADLVIKYNGIRAHIEALAKGGVVNGRWIEGKTKTVDGVETWESGKWTTPHNVEGLLHNMELAKAAAEKAKESFDAVVAKAKEIDDKQRELGRKIDEFEKTVTSGECNEELAKAMTEKHDVGGEQLSQIDLMRKLLEKPAKPLADSYKNQAYNYLDKILKPFIEKATYRNRAKLPISAENSLTQAQLAGIKSNTAFDLNAAVPAANSKAALFADYGNDNVKYQIADMPGGFELFADCSKPESKDYYTYLENIKEGLAGQTVNVQGEEGNTSSSDDAEKDQRANINELVKAVEKLWEVGIKSNPEGALKIEDAQTADKPAINFFDIIENLKNALKEDIVGLIKDPVNALSNAGNYTLLLTYDMAMFSNYTTTRPESIGKEEKNYESSITNVEISPKVNYFYQSEWEYLYNGDKNAEANLNAVSLLLFNIRLVCNYIAVFSIPEITSIVTSIQGAFSWVPPVGLVLGELARAAFVLGETVLDVAVLRTGNVVPLMKDKVTWRFKASSIPDITLRINSGKELALFDDGMKYSQYMLILFIAKVPFSGGIEAEANKLAERTGDLIEWNIINYQNKVGNLPRGERPGAMNTACADEKRFKLANLYTTFTLTTKAEMRMMFLSMPMAQKGLRGVIPPETLELQVVDQRGY